MTSSPPRVVVVSRADAIMLDWSHLSYDFIIFHSIVSALRYVYMYNTLFVHLLCLFFLPSRFHLSARFPAFLFLCFSLSSPFFCLPFRLLLFNLVMMFFSCHFLLSTFIYACCSAILTCTYLFSRWLSSCGLSINTLPSNCIIYFWSCTHACARALTSYLTFDLQLHHLHAQYAYVCASTQCSCLCICMQYMWACICVPYFPKFKVMSMLNVPSARACTWSWTEWSWI